MENIEKNLDKIHQDINTLKLAYEPKIIAVSKQQSIESMKLAYNYGQRAFGENYLQEGLTKINELKDLQIEWHFIGPIQSNKCKQIAEHFDWVQTLDRLKIAQRLDQNLINKKLNICIQVNISNEESKSGIMLDDIDTFIESLDQFENLTIRGLMAIPSNTIDQDILKEEFNRLKLKFDQIQRSRNYFDTLSMGMSADFRLALECGSTMIRVGSNIFGTRNYG